MKNAKNLSRMIKNAIIGKCPSCGKGALFDSYLKQVNNCKTCNKYLGDIRADDGPAWLTILIVGHLLAPFIIIFSFNSNWPDWLSISLWSFLAVILVLIILPKAKGLFIAVILYLRDPKQPD
jgi:uncharacterized protein (DUF983 family)